jgi:hypothetical protein
VLELLEDHGRCQVVLVTIPEETPVNEAVETAFSLEDRWASGLVPSSVNGSVPEVAGLDAEPVAAAERPARRCGRARRQPWRRRGFRHARMALQDSRVKRLRSRCHCPMRLPFLFTTDLGPRRLDVLARALLGEIDALPGCRHDRGSATWWPKRNIVVCCGSGASARPPPPRSGPGRCAAAARRW